MWSYIYQHCFVLFWISTGCVAYGVFLIIYHASELYVLTEAPTPPASFRLFPSNEFSLLPAWPSASPPVGWPSMEAPHSPAQPSPMQRLLMNTQHWTCIRAPRADIQGHIYSHKQVRRCARNKPLSRVSNALCRVILMPVSDFNLDREIVKVSGTWSWCWVCVGVPSLSPPSMHACTQCMHALRLCVVLVFSSTGSGSKDWLAPLLWRFLLVHLPK